MLGSPLRAIARYEQERDLPAGFVNRQVAAAGGSGAWARLERGELAMEAFYAAFEAECAAAGGPLCARTLFARMAEAAAPQPAMLSAIARIRESGLRTAALTNNWRTEGEPSTRALEPHFDVFVESSVVGLRKPDPRIYQLVCERLHVAPDEAVFLDDIGGNLKAARALGMTTIKVEAVDPALRTLEDVLGIPLRG